MRRILLPLVLLVTALILSGCGGNFYGCGGGGSISANPAYAGNYSAGFYPGGASNAEASDTQHRNNATPNTDPRVQTPEFSFTLAIAQEGAITGTATETSSGHTAAVTGTVLDHFVPCDPNFTRMDLQFTFQGENETKILGTRPTSIPIHWPFDSKLTRLGSNNQFGTMLLDRS